MIRGPTIIFGTIWKTFLARQKHQLKWFQAGFKMSSHGSFRLVLSHPAEFSGDPCQHLLIQVGVSSLGLNSKDFEQKNPWKTSPRKCCVKDPRRMARKSCFSVLGVWGVGGRIAAWTQICAVVVSQATRFHLYKAQTLFFPHVSFCIGTLLW